jgi:hypothetical protein
VELNGKQQSVNATITEYEKHGLLDVVRVLKSYVPPCKPDWKAYDGARYWASLTLRLLNGSNSPSVATEPNSLYDPEEATIFTLGKRTDSVDVPILPPPTSTTRADYE